LGGNGFRTGRKKRDQLARTPGQRDLCGSLRDNIHVVVDIRQFVFLPIRSTNFTSPGPSASLYLSIVNHRHRRTRVVHYPSYGTPRRVSFFYLSLYDDRDRPTRRHIPIAERRLSRRVSAFPVCACPRSAGFVRFLDAARTLAHFRNFVNSTYRTVSSFLGDGGQFFFLEKSITRANLYLGTKRVSIIKITDFFPVLFVVRRYGQRPGTILEVGRRKVKFSPTVDVRRSIGNTNNTDVDAR